MSTVENGSMVSIHYTGTLKDGSKFDSSIDREPLTFKVGSGQVISGFNDAVIGMSEGDSKTFTLAPEEAYGLKNEEAIQIVEKTSFPEGFNADEGEIVTGRNERGQTFNATIISKQDKTVTLDFNHPLAGEALTFEIQVTAITIE